MCPVCDNLIRAIDAAIASGDWQKARVMRGLLDNHRRQTCAEAQAQREQAAAVVEWKNQIRWIERA